MERIIEELGRVQSMIEDAIAEAMLDGKVKDKAVVTEKDGKIEINGK